MKILKLQTYLINFDIDSLVERLVYLHCSRLSQGLLASLGSRYLSELYYHLIQNSNIALVLVSPDDVVEGFVFGTTSDIRPSFHPFSFFNLIFNLVKKPNLVLNLILSILVNRNEKFHIPHDSSSVVELSYFVVSKRYSSKGWGSSLINKFTSISKLSGFSHIYTRSHNKSLTDYYLFKRKFFLVTELSFFGKYNALINWEC